MLLYILKEASNEAVYFPALPRLAVVVFGGLQSMLQNENSSLGIDFSPV